MCVCFVQWGSVSSYTSSQYGVCSHLPAERSAVAAWTPAAGHQGRERLQELQSVRKHRERQREQWCLQVTHTQNHTQTNNILSEHLRPQQLFTIWWCLGLSIDSQFPILYALEHCWETCLALLHQFLKGKFGGITFPPYLATYTYNNACFTGAST